jgi:hypothetical protein
MPPDETKGKEDLNAYYGCLVYFIIACAFVFIALMTGFCITN